MNQSDANDNPLVVRTDFGDKEAWQIVRAEIAAIPPAVRDEFEAMKMVNAITGNDISSYDRPIEFVRLIDDAVNADLPVSKVLELATEHDVCIFIVDRETISNPEH